MPSRALRSLVAPLLLVATVNVSFAATLGLSALVFDHLLHFPAPTPPHRSASTTTSS
ncbi:hypothetical protein GCM10022220_63800 [Actinocatenispora rupis]|uniref:Membrane transport protein MMPL domain-containing protein n=1 Tax=Actinocatenispora rupis TaxID=519421 RepID=A0A8J3NEL8_9ACTN|nr:hypothetical protein Aru02nite_36230 [Actinocatenispora rupis]